MNSKLEELTADLLPEVENLYWLFMSLQALCILNMMFLIQHSITFIFVKKMGRFFEFPTFIQITDVSMFASSFYLTLWIQTTFKNGLSTAEDISEKARNDKLMDNFTKGVGFKF